MHQRSAICCPRCGAIESSVSISCHRCGHLLKKVVADTTALEKFMKREDVWVKILQVSYAVHFVAAVLLAMMMGGSALDAFVPGEAMMKSLLQLGALNDRLVMVNGEWWRLLTATFAHAGVIHLFFNASALGSVGPETERNLGHRRFLLIYFFSALISNFASLSWHVWIHPQPFPLQVGASGAICGLIGALYSIAQMRGGVYDQVVSRMVKRWIVMVILFGLLVPGIDNVAHISGMVVGALITRGIGLKRLR